MSWAAVAAVGVGVLGYMTEQQRMSAQERANRENAELSREATAEKRRQFNIESGEMAQSRRDREDLINKQLQERFTGIRQENIGRLDPYTQAGSQAVAEQQALMGLSGQSAQAEAMSRFRESPGQKFLRERQEKSLLRNQAAIGGLGGGNVRTALQEQAFGLASTRLDDRLNRLQALSGRGLDAENTVVGMGYGPGYVQTGVDRGVASAESLEGGGGDRPTGGPARRPTQRTYDEQQSDGERRRENMQQERLREQERIRERNERRASEETYGGR
jgi:hypothetical protein